MNTAISTLWAVVSGRVPRAPEPPDAADMGTCFGLDMSLDDPLPPAAPVVRSPRPAPHWWQRHGLRKPARI